MSTGGSLNVGNRLSNCHAIKALSEREIEQEIFDYEASWHKQYRDSSYIFVGGIKTSHPDKENDKSLTEGDLVTVFSQWGDIYDVHLVRDHHTGKSRGFGFIGYEDARSCALAVDNANGLTLCGNVLTIDHVMEFRAPRPSPPEEELQQTQGMKKEYNDIRFWQGKSSETVDDASALKSLDLMSKEEHEETYKPSGAEGLGPDKYLQLESVRKNYLAYYAQTKERRQKKLETVMDADRGLNQIIPEPSEVDLKKEREAELMRKERVERRMRGDYDNLSGSSPKRRRFQSPDRTSDHNRWVDDRNKPSRGTRKELWRPGEPTKKTYGDKSNRLFGRNRGN